MFSWTSAAEYRRLWRYYQAGVVNTLFGYGVFAALVRFELNVFIAQILAHILGMIFNYFTYSRYAFSGHESRTANFVAAYGFNYIVSFSALFFLRNIFVSMYLCGLIATIIASAVNYLVLKMFVFRRRAMNDQVDA